MDSVTPAVSTLKKLSVLEPDLIMPPMLDRIVPSLQGLEETGRTPAVTYALSALAQPLAARQLWRQGGMYVADIFALLLPGIDLNDPAKTGLSCMAISNMVDFIRIGDIADVEENSATGTRALRTAPRPSPPHDPDESKQDQEEKQVFSDDEVNQSVRIATGAFRDWVPEFLGRVLLLFSNLPEEGGKSGKAGGKTEQLTLQSVLVSSACCPRGESQLMISTPAVASLQPWMRSCLTKRSSKLPTTLSIPPAPTLLTLSGS